MNFMFCNYFFIIANSYGFRRGFVRFMERDNEMVKKFSS